MDDDDLVVFQCGPGWIASVDQAMAALRDYEFECRVPTMWAEIASWDEFPRTL